MTFRAIGVFLLLGGLASCGGNDADSMEHQGKEQPSTHKSIELRLRGNWKVLYTTLGDAKLESDNRSLELQQGGAYFMRKEGIVESAGIWKYNRISEVLRLENSDETKGELRWVVRFQEDTLVLSKVNSAAIALQEIILLKQPISL